MKEKRDRGRGIAHVVAVSLLLGILSACVDQPIQPTPPVSTGEASPVISNSTSSVAGAPASRPQPRYIVVEHGQTLDKVAHSLHVSPTALAAANRLKPPYKIKIGSPLLIPDDAPPPIQQVSASRDTPSVAPPTPLASSEGQQKQATAAPPPPAQVAEPVQTPPAPLTSGGAPAVVAVRNPAAALPLPGEVLPQ